MEMMFDFWIHPSLVLIAAAVLLPLVPRSIRTVYMLGVPLLTFGLVVLQPAGVYAEIQFLDWVLQFGRVDELSRVFAIIMALMCLLGSLYALKVNDVAQHVAAWVYVGGSLGVIFAGDLLVLFLFWELMAISSVFLIWARRTPDSLAAGFRYLLVHTAGGLALLAGIVMHGMGQQGDFSFNAFAPTETNLAVWLILIGILLNAAAPPLHAWLPDAYPSATFSGSVFLSAFTTKTAVYALCRGFAGFEVLIVVGVVMSLYGVVYAFLANDSRRLLAYHIVSQVGFMVTGIGIGTALAVNGAIAHAFAHILYKGLLFMGTGAVLYQVGTSRFSELGGLYRKMPWTMLMTLVGAVSISGVPLFSGFVSKSMTISAGFEAHHYWAAFLLMLASIGTFVSIGLKLIHQIWFGETRLEKSVWEKSSDPGWNMMAAMGLTAFLCLLIGLQPGLLYHYLPHSVDYQPFTSYHLSETFLLLSFAALGYYLLRMKLSPGAYVCVDLDYPYRKLGDAVDALARRPLQTVDKVYSGLHESLGIKPLMQTALSSGRFDNRVIDAAVDGIARLIQRCAVRLRIVQRGSLQQNLTLTFAGLAALVVLIYLFT